MSRASSWIHRALSVIGFALATMSLAAAAHADVINLSLNVFYQNPANISSGGTWELVAKTDMFGLAGLEALLTNINPAVNNVAPRGVVNGSDPAGVAILGVGPTAQYTIIGIGQAPIHPSLLGPTEEQSVFYGVGTLQNGAPNYPGKPPGTNSIGPMLDSLTNVQNVPWATGDAFNDANWSTAARLVSGTFAPGVTPGFFQNATVSSSGNVYTTLGDDRNPGMVSQQHVTPTTIVRTNFTGGGAVLGDYNGNGRVDAADFVVWRNTLNQSGAGLPADGDNDGVIDQDDYNVWRRNFGRTTGPGAGLSSAVVPEPASAAMLAFAAAFTFGPRPSRRRTPLAAKNSC